jgi:hypothetical protein
MPAELGLLPTTKRCPGCGIKKPLEQFSKQRDKKDGHTSHCKNCTVIAPLFALRYPDRIYQRLLLYWRTMDGFTTRYLVRRCSHRSLRVISDSKLES